MENWFLVILLLFFTVSHEIATVVIPILMMKWLWLERLWLTNLGTWWGDSELRSPSKSVRVCISKVRRGDAMVAITPTLHITCFQSLAHATRPNRIGREALFFRPGETSSWKSFHQKYVTKHTGSQSFISEVTNNTSTHRSLDKASLKARLSLNRRWRRPVIPCD